MGKLQTRPVVKTRIERRRADWIRRVSSLAAQVTDWSVAQGWKVERHEKGITEEPLGAYTVPEIVVHLKSGQLVLAPVALDVIGGNGRVDLEATPTLARVKLVGVNGGWKLFADPNIPLRLEWNRRNFTQLAKDLLS